MSLARSALRLFQAGDVKAFADQRYRLRGGASRVSNVHGAQALVEVLARVEAEEAKAEQQEQVHEQQILGDSVLAHGLAQCRGGRRVRSPTRAVPALVCQTQPVAACEPQEEPQQRDAPGAGHEDVAPAEAEDQGAVGKRRSVVASESDRGALSKRCP
jgi:hypothetical protein